MEERTALAMELFSEAFIEARKNKDSSEAFDDAFVKRKWRLPSFFGAVGNLFQPESIFWNAKF